MTEKFKFGPLIWNHIDDDDDSGNYWWPGLRPLRYDDMGIPTDAKGLQCLPMSCPVHLAISQNTPCLIHLLQIICQA